MDVRKVVLEYIDRQSKFKQAEAEFDRYKKEFYGTVRRFMDRKGKSSFTFRDERNNSFSVSDVRPKKVTFDTAKMRQTLSADVCEQVMNRDVHVEDLEGFWKYMGQLGADEALVESFMRVDETVDSKRLDEMIDSGKLKRENLEGCYEVKVSDGYIKVTEVEQ